MEDTLQGCRQSSLPVSRFFKDMPCVDDQLRSMILRKCITEVPPLHTEELFILYLILYLILWVGSRVWLSRWGLIVWRMIWWMVKDQDSEKWSNEDSHIKAFLVIRF